MDGCEFAGACEKRPDWTLRERQSALRAITDITIKQTAFDLFDACTWVGRSAGQNVLPDLVRSAIHTRHASTSSIYWLDLAACKQGGFPIVP